MSAPSQLEVPKPTHFNNSPSLVLELMQGRSGLLEQLLAVSINHGIFSKAAHSANFQVTCGQ
jgi:hypothetical protein